MLVFCEAYRIVQQEHHGSEPPGPPLVEEYHLSHIADISNLRVTEAKFPDDEGRILHEQGNHDCQDQAMESQSSSPRRPMLGKQLTLGPVLICYMTMENS